MIGKILIYLATATSLFSVIAFFLSGNNLPQLKKFARISFFIMVLSIVAASGYLMSNIMNHNFQFTYVWEYSSMELTNYFLFASFYAGQQGSFMLWAFFLSLIGLYFLKTLMNKENENYSMAFYSLILLFIFVIMVFKSPFDMVWETFAKDGIKPGFMPENGRGLNPILQNYWITIHPPILFFGYSLLAVPFSLALSALLKREYQKWMDKAIPWTLFASGILGLGIMLGGFWAYETLGWGGFWAWDPVENSSLIPWLVATALAHTFLVQRRTGGLIRTNFVLSVLAFVLVLYATFLTRSGILGDTSVHSFVTPGKAVEILLVLFQVTFLVLGAVLLIMRTKEINKLVDKFQFKVQSKEFSLSIGSILILAFTLIVWYGTSKPAIEEILGHEKAAADISFYNVWGLWFSIIILMLNAISIYLKWRANSFDNLAKKVLIPLGVSVAIIILLGFLGLTGFSYQLLTFAAIFSVVTNLDYIINGITKQPKFLGAYIAHLGISILVLGVVASGPFSQTQQLILHQGETKKAFGNEFTFVGKERIEKHLADREKYKYEVVINDGKTKHSVYPIIYWSTFNNMQAPFLEPGIKTIASKDVYVSPKTVENISTAPSVQVKKDEETIIPDLPNWTMSVKSFKMNGEFDQMSNRIGLSAVINFKSTNVDRFDTLMTLLDVESWQGDPIWYNIPNTNIEVGLAGLVKDSKEIANSHAVFVFKKLNEPLPAPIEVFTFDVSIKPFILLVWIGTIFMVIGYFWSIPKHLKHQQNLNSKKLENLEQNGNGNGNKIELTETENNIAEI